VDSLKPIPTANRKDPSAHRRGGSFLLRGHWLQWFGMFDRRHSCYPSLTLRLNGLRMEKNIMLRPVALLSSLLLPPSGYGRNSFGHMAVAYVAYRHLEPQTKARADKLILLNPLHDTWKKQLPAGRTAEQQNTILFMIASTWPDQIRGDKSYHADGPEDGAGERRQREHRLQR